MKYQILIAALLFTCLTKTFAQVPEKLTAIAVNGLNLRSTPQPNGAVVTKIPFKASVNFLSCDSQLVVLPEMYHSIEGDGVISKDIPGYWVKVKYQQQTGYAFSAFLANPTDLFGWEDYAETMLLGAMINGDWQDFGLGFFSIGQEVYGAYGENGILMTERVNRWFINTPEGYIMPTFDLKRPYAFIFTTDRKITTGNTGKRVINETFALPLTDTAKKKKLSEAGLIYFDDGARISTSTSPNPAFQLNPDCPSEEQERDLFSLYWFGDLDGDGKKDYYYDMNNQEYSMDVKRCLWLSTDVRSLSNTICDYYSEESPYYVYPGNYYSIAKSGLNLRESDAPDGKVIAKIPFGERVRVLASPQAEPDTLGIGGMLSYSNYDTKNPENNEIFTLHQIGTRVFVAYQGMTGYVYSAFLCNDIQNPPAGNYFFKGWSDMYYHYDPAWNYYGLYWEDDKYQLRKTEPVFFSQVGYSEIAGGYSLNLHMVSSDKNRAPLYIIGARTPLREGFKGNVLSEEERLFTQTSESVLLKKLHLVLEKEASEQTLVKKVFVVRKNGVRQELIFDRPYDNDNAFYEGYLEWYGDLDGDGELDYIFYISNECGGDELLFMSAEDGQSKALYPVYHQVIPCGC